MLKDRHVCAGLGRVMTSMFPCFGTGFGGGKDGSLGEGTTILLVRRIQLVYQTWCWGLSSIMETLRSSKVVEIPYHFPNLHLHFTKSTAATAPAPPENRKGRRKKEKCPSFVHYHLPESGVNLVLLVFSAFAFLTRPVRWLSNPGPNYSRFWPPSTHPHSHSTSHTPHPS